MFPTLVGDGGPPSSRHAHSRKHAPDRGACVRSWVLASIVRTRRGCFAAPRADCARRSSEERRRTHIGALSMTMFNGDCRRRFSATTWHLLDSGSSVLIDRKLVAYSSVSCYFNVCHMRGFTSLPTSTIQPSTRGFQMTFR